MTARADVVLNSFESATATAFYDWIRRPSKTPECPVQPTCAVLSGPCASAYQTSSLASEGLISARVHLQPEASFGLNCDGLSDCTIERFRALTLYNFSPRDWSSGYSRLSLDVRRGQTGAYSLIFALRVEDNAGNVATSSPMNLTSTSTGAWQTLSLPITAMSGAGVDTTNLKAVCVILPLPLPFTCATVYLDNLRLVQGSPPCPPLAVSAVATGVLGQLRLGWTISCEGTDPTVSYHVYRSTAPIVGLPGVPTATVATGFLDSGLANGVRYYYRVVAVDAQGALSTTGDPADDDSDVPWGCIPPGNIASLSATATGTTVNLSWLPPVAGTTTLLEYQVLRATYAATPAGMSVIATIPHTGPGSYAHADVTVAPGGTYCYIIRTVETGGCSSTSPVACSAVPCNLAAPGGLSGLGYCDRIRLSWGALSATEYRIYRSSTGAACGAALVAQPVAGSTVWDDVAVVNGVTYAYTISAWSPTCESACSAEQSILHDSAAPCPPCLPPGTPAPPTLTAGSRRVTVTWTRPAAGGSPISRYFVWLGPGATGSIAGKVITATVWDQPAGPVFSLTVTGLAVDTTYCAIVETLDDGTPTCTSFSGESCVTTACVTPPAVVIASVSPVAAGELAVTWPRPVAGEEPLSRYLVLRSSVSGGLLAVAGTLYDAPVAGFTFTDTGLPAPLEYCYRIRTTDAAGCTAWSAEVCAACVAPGAPSAVTALAVSPVAIALGWIPATPGALGVSRYEVFRASFSGSGKTLVGIAWGPVASGFLDTPVDAFRSWFYALRAVDEAGCSTYSAERPYVYQPPGPVTPVTVTALLTAGGLHLEWSAPVSGSVNLTAYVIWRASTATGAVLVAGTIWHDPLAVTFTMTDAGMQLNRGWAYRIQVLDAIGGSAWSGPFTYTPAPPWWAANDPAFTVSNAGTAATVSWDAAAPGWLGVSRYLVFRSTNAVSCTGPLTLTGTVWDDGVNLRFSFTDTGLNPAATYGYRMFAIDLGGNTAFSSCGTVPPCIPPGAPLNLTAQPTTPTGLWLSWTPSVPGPNPVSAYAIYRSTWVGGIKPYLAGVWGGAASGYVDATANPLASWYYVLAVVDDGGCATTSAEGGYVYQPPGPVTPVTVTALLTAGGLHLEWSAPVSGSVNLTAYVIWRASTATGAVLVAGTIWHDPLAVTFTMTDAGMQLNRGWAYRIQVLDAIGGSAWSGPFTYTPAPPFWTGNDPAPAITPSGADLYLEWDAATPGWLAVSRYLVFRSSAPTPCTGSLTLTATIWDDGLTPRFSMTDTGLDGAAQYTYRWLAVDLGGSTAFSICSAAPPPPGSCSFNSQPVATVQPGPTGRPSIRITWGVTATGAPGTVTIWRGESATGGTAGKTSVATVNMTDGTWTDTGVQPGRTYCYVLTLGVPAIPCSATSMESCGQTAALLVRVYPNPAEPSKGPVRFDGLPTGSTVEVYTVTGDRVIVSPPGSAPLWLWDGRTAGGSPAAPGIYLYLIRGSEPVLRGTLVLGK